jgi:hypothetical protein
MYCVIRVRLALVNSPLARVDPVRPLAKLILRALEGEPDFPQIKRAASICPDQAQIILSLPHFTMKSQIKGYITPFGVTSAAKSVWVRHLNNADGDAVQFMLKNRLFARVIGISLVQEARVNEAFIQALPNCPPQCDVAYFFCRAYKRTYDPILRSWAGQNGSIYLDFLTLCRLKGFPIPDIPVPAMTPEQEAVLRDFHRQSFGGEV